MFRIANSIYSLRPDDATSIRSLIGAGEVSYSSELSFLHILLMDSEKLFANRALSKSFFSM